MKALSPMMRTLTLAGLLASPVLLAQQPAAPAPAAGPDAPEQPQATQAAPASPTVGTDVLPAPDRSSPAGATVTGALDSRTAIGAIQRQEFEGKDGLLNDIRERVTAADRALTEIQQRGAGAELDQQGRTALENSLREYQNAKTKLEQSLEAARGVEAPRWERVRATLATDYAFYTAAVAGVEVAAP